MDTVNITTDSSLLPFSIKNAVEGIQVGQFVNDIRFKYWKLINIARLNPRNTFISFLYLFFYLALCYQ